MRTCERSTHSVSSSLQYRRRSWLHAPGRGHDTARQEEQLSTRPKQTIQGAFLRAEPDPCSRQPTGHTIESVWRCSSSGTAPACDEGARVSQTKSRHRRRLHQMHLTWCSRGRRTNPRASTKDPRFNTRTLEFCTPCGFTKGRETTMDDVCVCTLVIRDPNSVR